MENLYQRPELTWRNLRVMQRGHRVREQVYQTYKIMILHLYRDFILMRLEDRVTHKSSSLWLAAWRRFDTCDLFHEKRELCLVGPPLGGFFSQVITRSFITFYIFVVLWGFYGPIYLNLDWQVFPQRGGVTSFLWICLWWEIETEPNAYGDL